MQSMLAIFWFLGMLFLVAGIFCFGLHRFEGTPLQLRTFYGIVVGSFMSVVLFGLLRPDSETLVKAFLVSLLIGIPGSIAELVRFKSRIVGHEFWHKYGHRSRILVSAVLVSTVMVFGHTPWGEYLMELEWPLLGLVLAILYWSILLCIYVGWLEHKLGAPIIERVGPPHRNDGEDAAPVGFQ